MIFPQSKKGFTLYGLIDQSPTPALHASSDCGNSWTWHSAGITRFDVFPLCVGGYECIDNGTRFDVEFFLWCCPLNLVGLVLFDKDVTLYETTTVTALSSWVRAVRYAPELLQRLVGLELGGHLRHDRKSQDDLF